jgi:nitrite reductase/ring-hydroxylating ferredoxin subunit
LPDEGERSERLERVVRELLAGRRLRVRPSDAPDRPAIIAAVWLAVARESYIRMSPEFRRRLAARAGGGAQPRSTRRQALVAGASGLAGVAVGLAGLGVAEATRRRPPAGLPPPALAIEPRPGRWTDVAGVDELPEGQGVKVTAGAVSAYLFRQGDRVSAVSSICSDLPCELDWRPEDGLLVCPCHLRTFTRDGRSTPTAHPLPALSKVRVRIENGRVLVLGT